MTDKEQMEQGAKAQLTAAEKKRFAAFNTNALAFMGDAVYEVYIRQHVMAGGASSAEKLHFMAVKYVRANGQAKALGTMQSDGFLSEEEAALVRRARNRKISSKPKNAGVMDYKLATAFEALVGYLYLAGEEERLQQVMAEAVRIIEDKHLENKHLENKNRENKQ